MPAAVIRRTALRCAILALAALAAACGGGTSRVGDQLTATSLSQSRKAVALLKLGAADPFCTVLQAGIGVREGADYRLVETARIVRTKNDTAVAEVELGSGEYHVVSYTCTRPGNVVRLAEPISNSLFKKSYASFSLAPGEVVNVGYLQLVPVAAAQVTYNTRVVAVRLAVTDWPLAELERFHQQRPQLYAQMKTRLMTVHKPVPPTASQVKAEIDAKCAEMKRLKAAGKLQNLPAFCTPAGGAAPRQPTAGKKKPEFGI
jgi:hypothetical protein